jgi:uncharacterized membrane protein YheB (UPF0754 family)
MEKSIMNLSMVAGPVVGAVIGYFTNSIAVKMMFRPLHPVKIGNFTLPFTPGLIPKGKSRLAKAIGTTVGEQLLTKESLTESLLSDSMKEKIAEDIKEFLQEQTQNSDSLHEVMRNYTTMEKIEGKKREIEGMIIDKIEVHLKNADLGQVVATEMLNQVNQYVQGTFLAMMVNGEMLAPIAQKIADRVNEYLENEGMDYIASALNMEADQLLNQSISVYGEKLYEEKEVIANMAVSIYEAFVRSKMNSLIGQIHISKIVEDKINEMDVLEVEELVLSIMKKELNSVVNLGAVIGFVIGIINIFI